MGGLSFDICGLVLGCAALLGREQGRRPADRRLGVWQPVEYRPGREAPMSTSFSSAEDAGTRQLSAELQLQKQWTLVTLSAAPFR
jgi:hypothetical protein